MRSTRTEGINHYMGALTGITGLPTRPPYSDCDRAAFIGRLTRRARAHASERLEVGTQREEDARGRMSRGCLRILELTKGMTVASL